MEKRAGRFARRAAFFTAAALIVPSVAQAKKDPGEELEEILEAQMENASLPLVFETLGLEELRENAEENGFSVQTRFGLSQSAIELLGMADKWSEESYLQMNFQAEEDAKRWQFDLEAGADADTPCLDFSLYGDADQLAMSIPQFYEGALAIRSGSFLDQYKDSLMESYFGELQVEEDLNLSFVPDDGEEEEDQENDAQEEAWEKVVDAARVEKKEDGEETVYSVIVPTKALLEFCEEQYDMLVETLSSVGTVTEHGDKDAFFACLEKAMEEECTLDFHTKDEFVTYITLETTIDTAQLEEYQENAVSEAMSERSIETSEGPELIIGGAVGSTDIYLGNAGVITEKLKFTFADPQNPSAGFDVSLSADGKEKVYTELSVKRQRKGATEEYTCHLLQRDEAGVDFDDDFYKVSFNSVTGDYDEVLNLGEENGTIGFDGTFTRIEPGKSFNLSVDGLTIADEEGIGSVKGNICVQTGDITVKAPEKEKMFLEMTEAQLFNFIMEVQEKVTVWQQKFLPELSEETEDRNEDSAYGPDGGLQNDRNAEMPEESGGDHPENSDGDHPEESIGDYPENSDGDHPEESGGDHPESEPFGDTAVA